MCVTGHGIDTDYCTGTALQLARRYAGRISPTGVSEMLSALDVLAARGIDFDFTIAGAPIFPEDERYLKEIEEEILCRPYASAAHCIGPVPYARMPETLVPHRSS